MIHAAKAQLARVLDSMGQVIEDGRNAVRGLRSSNSGNSTDLAQAFSRVEQELSIEKENWISRCCRRTATSFTPIIRDEVYRIGREALVNAFRHSGANIIEVDLEYSTKRLRVLVRDNGCGIDPQVLRSGRALGTFGYAPAGAGEIGAKLKVWSRVEGGTEVELSIPAHTAFAAQSSNGKQSWLSRIFPVRTKLSALEKEQKNE